MTIFCAACLIVPVVPVVPAPSRCRQRTPTPPNPNGLPEPKKQKHARTHRVQTHTSLEKKKQPRRVPNPSDSLLALTWLCGGGRASDGGVEREYSTPTANLRVHAVLLRVVGGLPSWRDVDGWYPRAPAGTGGGRGMSGGRRGKTFHRVQYFPSTAVLQYRSSVVRGGQIVSRHEGLPVGLFRADSKPKRGSCEPCTNGNVAACPPTMANSPGTIAGVDAHDVDYSAKHCCARFNLTGKTNP